MKLRIAVQGCCHGELNQIFKQVAKLHEQTPIDLLLILGDFQSLRSEKDFQSISIPPKYQKLGDFKSYYDNDGSKLVPPVLTLFIGGNHESMRHLMLLPYGGFAAEDIYYLGYSNVLWYRGIRIGSLSGIWKHWDVEKERPSYEHLEDNNLWNAKVRELYHVRKSELIPLFMLQKTNLDIMMSHDWPNGVVYNGNYRNLLRVKPFFEKDINSRQLGSPINWQLLRDLKPKWWLAAHLHVKYEATVEHKKRKLGEKINVNKTSIRSASSDEDRNEKQLKHQTNINSNEIDLDISDDEVPQKISSINTNEIDLDLSDDENTTVPKKEIQNDTSEEPKTTHFLALDKCLPRRKHLEIIEIENDMNHPSSREENKDSLFHDPEFIKNLRYLEKNRHNQLIMKRRLNDLNWNELISDRDDGNGESNSTEIDWEHYRVPTYTQGIQKKEKEQTHQFINTYFK